MQQLFNRSDEHMVHLLERLGGQHFAELKSRKSRTIDQRLSSENPPRSGKGCRGTLDEEAQKSYFGYKLSG
ncbi:hypothetical protein [uncultured Pseudomonas sp.]|uniref:hypothetical protein n=1 Tax=uncultured Pseudomonas sp. TaxID=114707 RepID=UPI0025FED4C4|nr:hypothetical protein [uncultured Pseudomonas sp.]